MMKEIWDGVSNYFDAASLRKTGEELMQQGCYEEAESALRESVEITKQGTSVLGGRCKSSLGFCLLQQGKVEEAEPLLRKGANGSDHGVTENMRYADFLIDHGRYEEAKEPLRAILQNHTNEGIDAHSEVQRKYDMCEEQIKAADAPSGPVLRFA